MDVEMEKAETVYCKDRKEWRTWLQENYHLEKGIWLIYYKRHTGKPSIPYNDAVEESICFGWIDGRIRKIDEEKYMQHYTPRKPKSAWSEINIGRAKKMIQQGSMTEWGLKIYQDGMKNNKIIPSSKKFTVPLYLKEALIKNKKAWGNFQNLAPSAKLAYVYWVDTAKTAETREKRIKKTVELIAQNKKYGEI